MTDKKHKLTKDEAFLAMRRELELDRLVEETSKMSDEEIYADLEKRGVPRGRVNALFAKQDAMMKEAEEAAAKKPPVAPPKTADVIPFRTKAKFALVGAGILTVLGGAAEAAFVGASMLAQNPSTTVPSADTATAAGTGTGAPANTGDDPRALREQAYTECGKTYWQHCLELLDKAKSLDVDGDRDAQVQATRALVSQMLTKDGG